MRRREARQRQGAPPVNFQSYGPRPDAAAAPEGVRRHCGAKKQFGSRRDARRMLKHLRGKDAPAARGLEVYRCRECDRFHLGHPPRARQEYGP